MAKEGIVEIDIGRIPSPGAINGMYKYKSGTETIVCKVDKNPKGLPGFVLCEYSSENGHFISKIMHNGMDINIPGSSPFITVYYDGSDPSNGRPILICTHYGDKHHWYKSPRSGHSWELEKSLEGIPPSDHSGIILKTLKVSRDTAESTGHDYDKQASRDKAMFVLAIIICTIAGLCILLEIARLITCPGKSCTMKAFEILKENPW